jgi:hypothetical protein
MVMLQEIVAAIILMEDHQERLVKIQDSQATPPDRMVALLLVKAEPHQDNLELFFITVLLNLCLLPELIFTLTLLVPQTWLMHGLKPQLTFQVERQHKLSGIIK